MLNYYILVIWNYKNYKTFHYFMFFIELFTKSVGVGENPIFLFFFFLKGIMIVYDIKANF